MLGLPRRSAAASIVEASEQPAARSGSSTVFLRREDRRGLGHEMHAAEDDDVGVGLGRFAREAERVADEIGDVLHFGALVVVREDDGVAVAGEALDLGL